MRQYPPRYPRDANWQVWIVPQHTKEADIIIIQQAIHIAKEDPESRGCVLCDDPDVFALLLFFYWSEKLQSSLTMQSSIQGRPYMDVKETFRKYCMMIPEILALHALPSCDSVVVSYGIVKKTAITVFQKAIHVPWVNLANWRQISPMSPIFHDSMLRNQHTLFFYDKVLSAAVGTEDWETNSCIKAM